MVRRSGRPRWSEQEAVALLADLFGAQRSSTLVGIGDDAALVRAPARELVLTVDACVEHVHFERAWLTLEDVGFRATNAAVSDLAAMGALPLCALSNLALPSSAGKKELAALARGQALAAGALGCPVVGGNLTRASELSVTTTVVGTAKRPLLRRGARPGNELWLVGDVGLAAAGLRLLRSGAPRRSPAAQRALAAWRRPEALLEHGQRLVGRATAACDISDGLARDALHVAEASRVRVVIERAALSAALPAALGEVARRLGADPLELALHGGEDYALLCTGPARRRPAFARRIGRVLRGSGVELEDERGRRRAIGAGFDHLSRK